MIALFCSLQFFAWTQIPNNGFESWSNSNGCNTPDGWDNLNPLLQPTGVYTCIKGTPGAPGNAYIKLVTTNVPGRGAVPGVATSGKLDTSNFAAPFPLSGFPFTERPQNLIGNWQFMAYQHDQGYIEVLLTKWDTLALGRDTVAYVHFSLRDMIMEWEKFSIDLAYYSSDYPDSALITLSSSGDSPAALSYLFVDSLNFAGSVSTSGVTEANSFPKDILIYPNPVKDILHIKTASNQDYGIAIFNSLGQKIYSELFNYDTELPTSNLLSGTYWIQLKSGNRYFNYHFIKTP